MFIRPWDKKSMRILHDLSLTGRAYTNDGKFVRTFGCKHREILDSGFLDIARTNYGKRPDKMIFITPPDVMVIPRPSQKGISYYFKRFKTL
jgi:hypothetical protein